MSVWDDIGTWVTGRNGVYRDSDKVDQAKTDLQNVKTNEISSAKDAISAAIEKINACTGMDQYVSHIDVNIFDEVIETASLGVDEVVSQIDAKVNDINDYDKGSFLQKVGGTAGMVFSKVGEGFVGAFEDVGDAVLTAGAWVTNVPKIWTGEDTAASKALQNAAKYDVSHNMFQWYYDSDIAKYSAITEDSGASSIARGTGQALGYMTMGGYLSGANRALADAGNLGKAATILQSTTNANTLVAAVGGFGSGSEAGLQKGYSLEASSLIGLKEGAIQGAMAYAAGKIGESEAVKAYERRGLSHTEAVAKAKEIGGYYDGVSGAARRRGYSDMSNIISNTTGKTGLSAVGGFATAVGQNSLSLAKDTATTVANGASSVANVIFHPIKTGKAVLGAVVHPVNTVKSAANAVGTAARYAAATPGTTAYVVGNALKDPAGDAIAATGIPGLSTEFGLGLSENRAASQFQTREEVKADLKNKETNPDTTGGDTTPDPNQNPNPDPNPDPNPNPNPNDYNNDDGGGGGGSNSQFRRQDDTEAQTEIQSEIDTEIVTEQTTEGTEAPSEQTTEGTEAPSEQTTQGTETQTEQTTQGTESQTEQTTQGGTTVIIQEAEGTGSGTQHTGGGYTGDGGYTADSSFTDEETSDLLPLDDALNGISSIDEIIGGKYTKIPTTTENIVTKQSGSSSVIPIAAGLSAAAAAGIGAKAYMDHKRNSENDDDDDYDDSDEWSDEDSIDISYDDTSDSEGYLTEEDDYGYQDQKYGARNNEELANIQ